ncbi:MAG TPA: permease, partial [Candidatus Hydrogenedentes bacterium]|nr:permease [Candidatus Hydrogenedentota bacterium]
MDLKKEWQPLLWITAGFFACYFLPIGWARFDSSIMEALHLARWYAQEHVVLCLLPAFFIAGAISVFLSQASVMKYLGAGANKFVAYGVASFSGTILAVCSCTVLPLFAGIWHMGAGLGPAIAFLYSGPAINILAIILTARILGPELGIARAVFAIGFSVVIGLCMHFIYRREELDKANQAALMPEVEAPRPLWQTAVYLGIMVVILIFANWGKPLESGGIWGFIFAWKWGVTTVAAILFGALLVLWFSVAWWKLVAAVIPTALVAFLL